MSGSYWISRGVSRFGESVFHVNLLPLESGGSRISQGGGGGATYYLTIFFLKLHENEEILAEGGVLCVS